MRTWFLVSVKYAKESEEGLLKQISEEYLFDAISFTEAESLTYTKLAEMIRGDFQIVRITRSNYVDVFFYEDADLWHSCKVVYHVADGDTGKEKKVTQHMLVTAENVDQAFDRIRESLSNMLVTFTIPEIKEKSKIMDVFPYEKSDTEDSVLETNE